ncbi:hypothetical protein [Streptococcus saliviloxodontae]|uniref:Uncharacterized protein n=1 Tax=Streptococcus saliviloxodontae TaxID=1349416 RepID=A0ABS2PJ59_9STRE|nr:hypothetical protein [Streptococcus saliviloxodontae]MBM7635381.1 hypothetical protein [Streptococcus saliviloxodontae]
MKKNLILVAVLFVSTLGVASFAKPVKAATVATTQRSTFQAIKYSDVVSSDLQNAEKGYDQLIKIRVKRRR